MLDMTLEDMVEAFVINSVRVCSIYDVSNDIVLKDIICDLYAFYLQSINILNRVAQRMIHNWVVEKRNAEKYKESLEESNWERVVAMDRVKSLRGKFSIWRDEIVRNQCC